MKGMRCTVTRNYVIVFDNWEPNRRLYYDFSEKAFYKDRYDRPANGGVAIFSKEWNRGFIYAAIVGLLQLLLGFFYMPDHPDMQPFAIGAAFTLATFVVYMVHRDLVKLLFKGKVVKTRVFSNRLDALAKKSRQRISKTISAMAWAIVIFILFAGIFSTFYGAHNFGIVMAAWGIIPLAFLEFRPHKQIKFFKQLKRGEIWIDKAYD